MKKNAQLNILMRIKQKVGIILPITMVMIFISTIAVIIAFFLSTNELKKLEIQDKELKARMADYNSKKEEIISYSKMKDIYNEYFESLLNYSLIFKTIENYIPSNSLRNSLRINNNSGNITASISTEIEGYEEYMTFLRLIDKCSFVSEQQKASLLNIQRVELGGAAGESLSESVTLNIAFNFSTSNNEYILLKKYEQTVDKLDDLGKFLHFINVSKGLQQDTFSEARNYSNNLEMFYNEKMKFSKTLSEITKTDNNGFFLSNTGENFITKTRSENLLIEELLKYYNNYKRILSTKLTQINNSGDIIYSNGDNKTIVLNLKDNYNDYIIEINKQILSLEIMKRYNNYLLDNNYLNTFSNLNEKGGTKSIIINGERTELSIDEYITYIIGQYNIISEDDPILTSIIKTYNTNVVENETIFNDKEKDLLEQEIKQAYIDQISLIKTIDSQKQKLFLVDTYIDNFYSEYVKYNGYIEELQILNFFFNQTMMDVKFLNSINYPFLNFTVRDNLSTYKKRFLLTIENNRELALGINAINSEDLLIQEIKRTEDFIKKTTDMVLYRNNNIDCITKDVKTETRDIYETLLGDKQNEQEKNKIIQEIDIIINTYNSGTRD